MFYSLTLEAPSAPTAACLCNVIPELRTTEPQLFEARGDKVYLKRLVVTDHDSKLETILEQNVFSIVRDVGSFKIPGTKEDFLTISSDSGRMVMLRYDIERNRLEEIHLETFGKSGIRRTIPGQYLAVDPRGRCLMMASVEKNKVCYIFQRRPSGEITISSPHEANQSNLLCTDLCALDTHWSHPMFAAIEVDYAAVENGSSSHSISQKSLNYYTVDLGLNHVAKSWTAPCDPTANKIFTVPGGTEGPSGALVCAEGRLYYMHKGMQAPVTIPIPQRQGALETARSRYIVCGSMFCNKKRQSFFFLLQTDDGDVFKLTLEMTRVAKTKWTVDFLRLRYFETLPLARSMLIIQTPAFLYVLAETGPSMLYHIMGLADDEDFEPWNSFDSATFADHRHKLEPLSFRPRDRLKYLSHELEIPALHPLMRTDVENLTGEDTPQIYAIQGRGHNSVFKTIRHGVSVEEIVASPLGNVPYDKIWSLKRAVDDEYHYYILLSSSYTDRTTVLGIGDEVETLEDTSFLASRATITAAQMGEDSHVQVHARGVRTISGNGAVAEWPCPTHCTIAVAAANQRQLILGLSSNELAFFFMGTNGELNALEDFPEMSDRITAIGIGPTPKGQQQAKYGVVGCEDKTIRVLSTDLDSPLEARSVQALSDVPTSIEVVEMVDPKSNGSVTYVHIGLKSGLYLRAIIDEATGELSDVRTKFLGHKPVRIFPMEIEGQQCVICCSSRPWVGFNHPISKLYTMTPLVTGPMTAASSFITEHISGICGIADSDLRIFNPPRLGERFVHESVQLENTPRNFVRNPWFPLYYVIESDGNTLSKATENALLSEMSDKQRALPQVGQPFAPHHWASCVQVVDPINSKIESTVYLEDNETALCCACVGFEARDWEVYLLVGTGQDMDVSVKETGYQGRGGGFLHVYRLMDAGTRLEFLHKTRFPEPIHAIAGFQGRVAVGVGAELLIYDIGTKAMLRKTRGAKVPNRIVTINTMGNRLVCGDVAESVSYVVYKPTANRLIVFCDDFIRRWTTTNTMVDYETTVGGDKFGNIWSVRCPEEVSAEADEEGMGGFIVNERSFLNGAPYRLDEKAHIFVNDVPMTVKRTPLVPGGQDVVFWSGISGTMGAMIPFVARQDVTFFHLLEIYMRNRKELEQIDKCNPPLTGRDQLTYRGYYSPVRGFIDGDFCERFLTLPPAAKQWVATEMENWEVPEIEKRIVEMRTRAAF